MPIIDLQRRMVEVGRIRMGSRKTPSAPGRKLEHWRLTSRDRSRLDAAAELYGGQVEPWPERDGEFELYTTTTELPILLLPGQTLSQWYETWSGGGCQRRCDGERDHISEQPCICDTEPGERACKPTTRLSVMLPDVPGLGCWRLESHGYYAAVELSGTAAMLEQATARGQLLPARIRIDQRSKVDGGKTTRYAVPVIDIDITMRQALPGAVLPALEQPTGGFTPVAQFGGVTLEDGLAAVNREAEPRVGSGRQTAAIGPPPNDPADVTPPIPVDEPAFEQPSLFISDGQRTLLWTTVTSNSVPELELRRIVTEHTGQESTKAILKHQFDAVLADVQRLASPASAALEDETNELWRQLLQVGKDRGKEDTVRASIEKKHRTMLDEPEAFRDWLQAQLEKASQVTA